MTSAQLLLALLALPLVGGVACAFVGAARARWVALAVTLASLALAVALALQVGPALAARPADSGPNTFRPLAVTQYDVIVYGTADAKTAVQFYVGVDGLNLALLALTALLGTAAVLATWDRLADRAHEFYAWLLLLEAAVLGAFAAFDVLLFYTCFELTLIPLFFLIGHWGGPVRREAAMRFVLYTLAGSLITLVGLIGVVLVVYLKAGTLTFELPRLITLMQLPAAAKLDTPENRDLIAALTPWLFAALSAGFLVKVPLVPFHTWQPLTYAETPTGPLLLLAGVLAKLGTYGLLRLVIPLLPDASLSVGLPVLGGLAVGGGIYAALCAFAQNDLKRLLAYSSIAHLGLCTLGLFALTTAGVAGGLLHMVNHGLYTAGLFLLVGCIQDRYGTRLMTDLGGIAARVKWLAVFAVVFSLASVGLPGLNGFVGELLVLAGTYDLTAKSTSGPLLAILALVGIVLGAWYTFTMLKRTFFGPEHATPTTNLSVPPDLSVRELTAVLPLALLCLLIGLKPQPLLNVAKADIAAVVRLADAARLRAGLPPPPALRPVAEENDQ